MLRLYPPTYNLLTPKILLSSVTREGAFSHMVLLQDEIQISLQVNQVGIDQFKYHIFETKIAKMPINPTHIGLDFLKKIIITRSASPDLNLNRVTFIKDGFSKHVGNIIRSEMEPRLSIELSDG